MTIYKKINLTISGSLLLVLVILFSCEKEAITVTENNDLIDQEITFRTSDDNIFDQIEFDGEMFVFDSWEEFSAVEAYLADLVDEHNETFGEVHNDLSDEAYNTLVDELGFDEFQPLTDFEEQFGIQSKRQQINEQVNGWLAISGEELDMATYPDHFPILSQEARSLINQNSAVKIADVIITFDDVYEPSNTETFPCIEEAYVRDFQVFSAPLGNILFMLQTSSVSQLPFSLFHRAETSTIAFQFSGIWKPFRMRMTTQISGVFRAQCFGPDTSTLSFLANRSYSFGRFSQQSASYLKSIQPHPQFLGGCDIIGKFGNGQYVMSHCLN